ncbi:MAG TPA: helix-turn-helix transcriptional regulator [Thermoanaerobaculia bacterium]|jgi:transcriptional regulator with XRE-family HTH domain|nr:helix-turn-helix transcriptional regulator [Thermoanaerobaculia bacterium]
MSNPEIVRMLAVLRDAIRLARFTNREVERRLGWSSGYLSRLFAGLMELRVEHVLNICSVIGFPPNEYFRAVYPDTDSEAEGGSKLRQALERLHPEPGFEPKKAVVPAPAPKSEAPTEQDIQRMLLSALRKLLQEGPENKAAGD